MNAHAHPAWRRRCRALCLPLVLLIVMGMALPASADCVCPEPTLEQLQREPGFELEERGFGGFKSRDYVETDGGECEAVMEGEPVIERQSSTLVLRAQGEVWDCPHSKSGTTIIIERSEADTSAWSMTNSAKLTLESPVAEFEATFEQSISESETITEVTRVEKTVIAKHCRRIPYFGYVEVAIYTAKATFNIQRRYAWWTKNDATGSTVHAKGSTWVDCGSLEASFERKAAIRIFLRLFQRACNSEECRALVNPEDKGWFPKLPEYLDPPELPFDPLAPDAENGTIESEEQNDGPEVAPAPVTTGGGEQGDDGEPTVDQTIAGEEDEPEAPTLDPDELGEPPTGPLPPSGDGPGPDGP